MPRLRRQHGDTSQGGVAPLLQYEAAACKRCWGCVRYCPSRAIRIVEERGEIIDEKCVKCGACVSECANHGHVVRDDVPEVRALLASGRPVVAVLATEFVAALHPRPAGTVERMLEAMGFYAVESTLLGEELVAAAYESRHNVESGVPVIRSTCPVVAEWVRRFHPRLTGALAPVVPPYVAQARLIRELYPPEAAVVYAGPCYARKDEWREPDLHSAVDAVIDLGELARMLDEAGAAPPDTDAAEPGLRRPEPLKELSLTDGFPRATLASRTMLASDVQVVRGLKDLDRLLYAIEAGEAAPLIVDALSCEGCIDGPAVNPGMSLFAKRNIDAAERESRVRSAVSSQQILKHLPSIELVRTFVPSPVSIPVPDDASVDEVLAAGQMTRGETIDCGACGYATCVEHAVAIYQGNSSWDLCFPLQRDRYASSLKQLEASATLDSLTGLWNRRVFSERLAEEMARHARYSTPLSLLMIDLDGFKEINDRHGHLAGDDVLVKVARVLSTSLRMTDLPCRYGGDEFAVVLPGVHKTDAFAVAEKIRESIAGAEIGVEGNGSAQRIRASIGVASASRGMAGAIELVEAADHALYRAKEAGKDQVRLAPD